MALNQRERRLALATGSLLTIAAVQFGYNTIQSAFDERQTRIDALNQEIRNKDATVLRGRKAAKKLQAWRAQSLPSDLELARSLYKNWLGEVVERNKLAQADVTVGADAPHAGIYTVIPVTVKGKGRLDQILSVLHEIYQADYLQLVRQIQLTPLAESGGAGFSGFAGGGGFSGPGGFDAFSGAGGFDGGGGPRFDLSLVVEALALPKAELKNNLNDRTSERLAWTDLAQYRQPIEARNLFVAYRPPAEEGDPAQNTFVTAVTGDGDDYEAWLVVRSADPPRLMKLEEGDTFDVGKLEGRVTRIARQSVDIEAGGRRRRVALGSSLAEGRELP